MDKELSWFKRIGWSRVLLGGLTLFLCVALFGCSADLKKPDRNKLYNDIMKDEGIHRASNNSTDPVSSYLLLKKLHLELEKGESEDTKYLNGIVREVVLRSDPVLRSEVLSLPAVWLYAAYTRQDIVLFIVLACGWGLASFFALLFSRDEDRLNQWGLFQNPLTSGQRRRKYLYQDFGLAEVEQTMHHHRITGSEYGGLIHWFRDTIEKTLSIALIIVFLAFVARLISYVLYWFSGEGWRLVFLPLDVNAAVTVVGVALIIDSIILVSTMTDAPGIARTLDAVIVALAGYVIMLIDAAPGKESFIRFRFSNDKNEALIFPCMIALLFMVRWFVRNPTLQAMYSGRLPNQYVVPLGERPRVNLTGDEPRPRPARRWVRWLLRMV